MRVFLLRVRQVLIGFVAKTRAGQDVRKYSASQITYQTVPVQRLSVFLPVSEQGSLPLADPDLHMCHEEMRMPADLVQHVVSPPPAQDRPLLGQEDQEDPDATRPLPELDSEEDARSYLQINSVVIQAMENPTQHYYCWECETRDNHSYFQT